MTPPEREDNKEMIFERGRGQGNPYTFHWADGSSACASSNPPAPQQPPPPPRPLPPRLPSLVSSVCGGGRGRCRTLSLMGFGTARVRTMMRRQWGSSAPRRAQSIPGWIAARLPFDADWTLGESAELLHISHLGLSSTWLQRYEGGQNLALRAKFNIIS